MASAIYGWLRADFNPLRESPRAWQDGDARRRTKSGLRRRKRTLRATRR